MTCTVHRVSAGTDSRQAGTMGGQLSVLMRMHAESMQNHKEGQCQQYVGELIRG